MAADALKYAIGNAASTTLSSSVGTGATTAALTSDSNFNAKSGEGMVILDEGTASEEIAYSTGKTGATLALPLVNRGLEGGSAQAHDSQATVKGILTSGMWNDMVDSLTNILDKETGDIDSTKLTAGLSAASDTAAGKVELATTAETTTGTDATRAVTPDGLHDMTSLAGAAWFLDEDNMASDSATKVPSQQSVKAYVDANSGSASSANFYANMLINGGFDVWQRATTFTTPNDDTYGPDRWNFLVDGNGAWTFARDTDVPGTGVSKYSLKCTNVTLNKQCGIVQVIENINSQKIIGGTVSLSFYAKTTGTEIGNLRATVLSWNSTGDSVTSDVVGTWAGAGTDPTWAANWTAEVAGSNKALTASWQRFTIENVNVDTASTTNIAVVVWVDDTTIAANDDFWITGIQLNQGTTAIGYMPTDVTKEILSCQRYCYVPIVEANGHVGNGHNTTTTNARIGIPLPVTMRTVPALTATGSDWQVEHAASAAEVTGIALVSGLNSTTRAVVDATTSGLTAGQAVELRGDGSVRTMILSAEL